MDVDHHIPFRRFAFPWAEQLSLSFLEIYADAQKVFAAVAVLVELIEVVIEVVGGGA